MRIWTELDFCCILIEIVANSDNSLTSMKSLPSNYLCRAGTCSICRKFPTFWWKSGRILRLVPSNYTHFARKFTLKAPNFRFLPLIDLAKFRLLTLAKYGFQMRLVHRKKFSVYIWEAGWAKWKLVVARLAESGEPSVRSLFGTPTLAILYVKQVTAD